MKNTFLFVFLFCFSLYLSAQITLSHNVGNTPISTDMFSCEDRDEGWSKIFKLSDFGIKPNEQFLINSLQVALSESNTGARLQFSVYSIDENFPSFFHSLYPRSALGGRGYGQAPLINGDPEIIDVNFEEPIVVPAGTERILVTVHKIVDFYNPESARVVVAGTAEDTGESWYHGCDENYSLTRVDELNSPVPNANFYINVTGEVENIFSYGSNVRLTHNVCDQPVWINQYGRSGGGIKFSRAFYLDDFGISNDEEFVIDNVQAAFSGAGAWDVRIQCNIYKIDSDFPDSFSTSTLLGSSEIIELPQFSGYNPVIFNFSFINTVVVPNDVERILVEIYHLPSTGYSASFIAGTEYGNDVSWLSNGVFAPYTPVNLNYYINVTGNVNHISNNFEMNISNICSEFLKEFSVENQANVASVVWDFGDPASGVNNTSTDFSPFHDFSADGTYTITATVTGNDASVEILTETIHVTEPPEAYGIDNIYACEDTFNSGISSTFDTSNLLAQVLGGQNNKVVKFIDSSGNEYDQLPNPFTNSSKDIETVTVRVSHENNPCCYSEITFDLIVNPQPNLENVEDLIVCSNETNGFSTFNLQDVQESLLGNSNNLQVLFFHEDGEQIQGDLTAVENTVANEEEITAQVHNTDTNCYNETTFKLKANPLPVAHVLSELVGCDDNDDGISEYFNTSNVETEVLGNQTGLLVTYFNASGEALPNPLPNPYTNATANREEITVRVTNPATACFSEAVLVLNTSTKPQINAPQSIFSCDLGNGYSDFDTSNIESEIIGSQNGLKVLYFDTDGNEINNFISSNFRNTTPWQQSIDVRVENEFNSACYSETSLNLVVNELPSVTLQDSYFLCDLEPFYMLRIDDSFDSYLWEYQDGSQVSTSNIVNLEQAGNYTLTLGKTINNTYCENSFNVALVRSQLPTITSVEKRELSDKNYVEVFVSGDGDFEYSIDGENFQNSNLFENILGGIYSISVRDKLGCGADNQTVVLVDYPKYFTPNNDGINDYWQIKGVENFPEATVFIYDRYGKILKQLKASSIGWDGTFRGEFMQNSDYWFTVKLDENYNFKGHFSLKR